MIGLGLKIDAFSDWFKTPETATLRFHRRNNHSIPPPETFLLFGFSVLHLPCSACPPPSPPSDHHCTPSPLPSPSPFPGRYMSMGLSIVQSKENMVTTKVMKQMNRSGVQVTQSNKGINSNIIRNLTKNFTH
ncbi:hypothetical protein L1987_78618 [Smallanthus sonchifolius]|uniref:Uncharacterized protein n=1 Tax=Smallanthus sonchifolius TaxID=185202 RepID=A0ACB8ZE70_9ASTR|nr:hypothetical protein L1987_78618 [Smallanthus sonchifolius]